MVRIDEPENHPHQQKQRNNEEYPDIVQITEDLQYTGITDVGNYRFIHKHGRVEYFIDIDPDLMEKGIYEKMFEHAKKMDSDLVTKHHRQKLKAQFFLAAQTPKSMSAKDAIKPAFHSEDDKPSSENIQDPK